MNPFRNRSEREIYLDETERERIRERERLRSEERQECVDKRRKFLAENVLNNRGLFLLCVIVLAGGFGMSIYSCSEYWEAMECGDVYSYRPISERDLVGLGSCGPRRRLELVRGDAGVIDLVVCRCRPKSAR